MLKTLNYFSPIPWILEDIPFTSRYYVCIMFVCHDLQLLGLSYLTVLTQYGMILHSVASTVSHGMVETYWWGSQTFSADLHSKGAGRGAGVCRLLSDLNRPTQYSRRKCENENCCWYCIMRWWQCTTCVPGWIEKCCNEKPEVFTCAWDWGWITIIFQHLLFEELKKTH